MLVVRRARADDCAVRAAIEKAAGQRYAGTPDAVFWMEREIAPLP
jgi:hypothetical protein